MVDFRSDTVTRPTEAMREAMARAPVGDDVFGDDPTVNALQERVAREAGKEAALLVPSGTMANQLALRAQTSAGDEVLLHARSHILNYEGGGAAAISGLLCRAIDSADGALDGARLSSLVHDGLDPHHAPTRLLCLENTHNGCGGVVVPHASLAVAAQAARASGLRTHLDGARLWNALAVTGQSLREAAAPFDTVSLCFSKGLGAPVGSILVGDHSTIARAHRFRKMLGGGMRQAGILAAAADHALTHHRARLAEDHRRADVLARALGELPAAGVEYGPLHTNLVYFTVDAAHPLRRDGDLVVASAAEHGVLITGGGGRYRAALHLDVTNDGLTHAIDVLRRLLV
ncbi:MAG: aminotransferase class I/II-fold pyridoxal phosphate-dependent enzyme [Deltaproteobacteria bacterium]|nr:MAG: aminotransferase class I/II-fold pyridoxal phosphate-dependent enzyme [Deltaproteobacteria bacterium]